MKPGDLNPTISDAAPAASGPDLTVSDAPRLPILARGPDALLSVIVPVYNEAQVIGDFLGALQQFLGALDLRWEVVVVDDGSTDGSPALALAASRSHAVRVVRLSRNFGKEAAMTAGLQIASGDAVVIMDADFQHPLETLPVFIARWREGYDMVYGVRHDPGPESVGKRLLRWAFHQFVGREDRIGGCQG